MVKILRSSANKLVIWPFVGAIIALLAASPSTAQVVATNGYVTGDQLITRCTSTALSDGNLCLGYILGIADSMQAVQARGGALIFDWRACLPSDATAAQLQKAVLDFLIVNPLPAQRTSASGLVAKALSDAFPCVPR
jgi:hypothetical protein